MKRKLIITIVLVAVVVATTFVTSGLVTRTKHPEVEGLSGKQVEEIRKAYYEKTRHDDNYAYDSMAVITVEEYLGTFDGNIAVKIKDGFINYTCVGQSIVPEIVDGVLIGLRQRGVFFMLFAAPKSGGKGEILSIGEAYEKGLLTKENLLGMKGSKALEETEKIVSEKEFFEDELVARTLSKSVLSLSGAIEYRLLVEKENRTYGFLLRTENEKRKATIKGVAYKEWLGDDLPTYENEYKIGSRSINVVRYGKYEGNDGYKFCFKGRYYADVAYEEGVIEYYSDEDDFEEWLDETFKDAE